MDYRGNEGGGEVGKEGRQRREGRRGRFASDCEALAQDGGFRGGRLAGRYACLCGVTLGMDVGQKKMHSDRRGGMEWQIVP